ncbi:MAG: hypothetical protein LC753_15250 [Acidobacteria bacterium]|nr:hypothetical protein [Acidobacteriota bacterium]
MKCLNDAEIQAAADNESPAATAHARTCPACGEQVRERQMRNATLAGALAARAPLPADVARRVEAALSRSAASRGATRERPGFGPTPRQRQAWWGAAAIAAATLIVVVFVAPMLKGPATVSAAGILAESANRLAEPTATGVEFLDYEIVLDGLPREIAPEQENGVYRVKQRIDHAVPGRYHFASYTADGRLLSSITQDPAAHRRVATLRLDDQPYRFDFRVPNAQGLSIVDVERLHMEATVAMMQASGNQQLQILDGPSGRQYLIQVPQVSGPGTNPVWDIREARVVIDAQDYRIVEFFASGTLLKQPYSVSYTLISREIRPASSVAPGEFAVPADAAAVVIEGDGTMNPTQDALLGALREVARLRKLAAKAEPRVP